jgi:hypothetical protein
MTVPGAVQAAFVLALAWALGFVDVPQFFCSTTPRKPPPFDACQCTIERVEGLSLEAFWQDYAGKRPFIFPTENRRLRKLVSLQRLRSEYGQRDVTLASANTFSHSKISMSMAQYLDEYVVNKEVTLDNVANETWYFFGDHDNRRWHTLFSNYRFFFALFSLSSFLTSCLPRFPEYVTSPRISFGVGPHHSGVPFHFHGPGFSE